MKHFSSLFGMFGCLPPWSKTSPLTSLESWACLCIIVITSIMFKSISSPSLWIISTASVTIGAKRLVHCFWTLVDREVWATFLSRVESTLIFFSFYSYRISIALFLAISKPSVMILGWTPSKRSISACLRSSPMKRTLLVVPSPTDSS